MVDNLAVKQALFSRGAPSALPKPPDEYRLSVLLNVEIALIDQNEAADWSGSAVGPPFSVVIMSSLSAEARRALLLAASLAPVWKCQKYVWIVVVLRVVSFQQRRLRHLDARCCSVRDASPTVPQVLIGF